jgi:AcrR family transcriptional regulator
MEPPVSPQIPQGDPDRPDELARLPHGRHGLPAEFVEHNQRERLIAAFTAIVGEAGYGEATIEAITAGAGVSSRAFYKYFKTIEDCYIGAFERAVEGLEPAVAEAYAGEAEWPRAIRAALLAGLGEFSERPEVARLLTSEPFVAGPGIARHHEQLVERLVPFLHRGRELRKGADSLPPTTERGLLGAANSLIARHALGSDSDYTQLLPDLLQFILIPYLGAAESRRLAIA